jgi:hypothetical protein
MMPEAIFDGYKTRSACSRTSRWLLLTHANKHGCCSVAKLATKVSITISRRHGGYWISYCRGKDKNVIPAWFPDNPQANPETKDDCHPRDDLEFPSVDAQAKDWDACPTYQEGDGNAEQGFFAVCQWKRLVGWRCVLYHQHQELVP